MLLRVFRRIDDLAFIEELMNKSYMVMVVPHKNLLVAWLRRGERVESDRVFEEKKLRNGIVVVKARLSL